MRPSLVKLWKQRAAATDEFTTASKTIPAKAATTLNSLRHHVCCKVRLHLKEYPHTIPQQLQATVSSSTKRFTQPPFTPKQPSTIQQCTPRTCISTITSDRLLLDTQGDRQGQTQGLDDQRNDITVDTRYYETGLQQQRDWLSYTLTLQETSESAKFKKQLPKRLIAGKPKIPANLGIVHLQNPLRRRSRGRYQMWAPPLRSAVEAQVLHVCCLPRSYPLRDHNLERNCGTRSGNMAVMEAWRKVRHNVVTAGHIDIGAELSLGCSMSLISEQNLRRADVLNLAVRFLCLFCKFGHALVLFKAKAPLARICKAPMWACFKSLGFSTYLHTVRPNHTDSDLWKIFMHWQ